MSGPFLEPFELSHEVRATLKRWVRRPKSAHEDGVHRQHDGGEISGATDALRRHGSRSTARLSSPVCQLHLRRLTNLADGPILRRVRHRHRPRACSEMSANSTPAIPIALGQLIMDSESSQTRSDPPFPGSHSEVRK